MTITYDGTARHDPSARAILYNVRIDDTIVHCSFATDALAFCVDDLGDPLEIFNSCRLLILAYTKCSLLRRGVRVDGQYELGLGRDNEDSSSRSLAILQVEPRYEDDADIFAGCIEQKTDRNPSHPLQPTESEGNSSGERSAIA
jgi:hypothetical protein